MKIERRFFGAEVRAGKKEHRDGMLCPDCGCADGSCDCADAPAKITGHAAVFNQDADIAGLFVERIAPGAFADTIQNDDIRALWNHNPDIVLGRNKAGTLALAEDDTGLAVEIMPPCSAEREVESIERGDVSQMSIGMIVMKDQWEKVDGKQHRTILTAQLFDVSPVTYPAYTGTDVQVRSAAEVASEIPAPSPTAGQEAPPATSGAVDIDHFRRYADIVARG